MKHNIDEKNEILSQLNFSEFYDSECDFFIDGKVLGEADCPLCDNEDLSLQINLVDGNFACLSCAAAGSVFDFLMKKYKANFEKVLAFLVETAKNRSEGETNTEVDSSEAGKCSEGFYFERDLYRSPAFLSLGKNSVKALIAFLDTIPGNGGGELSIPHNFLEDIYKIPRSGISRAIGELQQKKFLKLVHHGGRGKGDRNFYCLSEDYKFWTPEKEGVQIENIESVIEDLTE